MSPRSQPRIVAELGRPETPQETADRKAENSRNYRKRKTVNNLVYSLLVCVGLVLVIALAVPRADNSLVPEVDYSAVATQAQSSTEHILVNPELPGSWSSNRAETDKAGGVSSWNIGLITPAKEFIGITRASTPMKRGFPSSCASPPRPRRSRSTAWNGPYMTTGDVTMWATWNTL
jgi:hypothetical protein